MAQVKTDLSLSGTNTGDQTSIVGITGTTAQFNTALTDGDFATTATTLDAFANPVASLDFAQQETLQFVIENRTSDPGSPVAGQLWLRTDL